MDEPVKILISGDNGEGLPPPYGGIIKRCLLHAKEWKKQGAQVFIHIHHKHENEEDLDAGAEYFYDFARKPSPADKIKFILRNFFANPFLFAGLFYSQLDLLREFILKSFLYCAARGVYLNEMVKKIRPDIMITETGSPQSLVAIKIAKRHITPIILENYAEIQYKGPEEDIGINFAPKYKRFWEYLVNNVALVVPPSQHCSAGPRLYLKDTNKMRVIYSGVNFDVFNGHFARTKEEARKEFNLPTDKFLIMAVGALRTRKGHIHLIEALLKLSEDQLNRTMLVLCGMGDIEAMKQRARELNFPVESLRIFQGLTEGDLAKLYAAMDCFCVMALTARECMGMALKEAMSIGLPIVAYNVGGVKEAVENEVNGFLIPPGDRQGLVDSILKIMSLNDDEERSFKENNIAKVEKLFDIKKTAALLFDEIRRLTSKHE